MKFYANSTNNFIEFSDFFMCKSRNSKISKIYKIRFANERLKPIRQIKP